MKGFSKFVVKHRVLILILGILLLIPAVYFFINTRINYDVLTYLPEDIETMKGEDIMTEEFGTGAFSFLITEGMADKDVSELRKRVEEVDHVKRVVWYDSILDISVPEEMLPEEVVEAFRSDDCTMMAVIYDKGISADETLTAVNDIRKLLDERAFLSGMSAVVVDTKELCDKEVPIYVGIAVLLSIIVLSLTMDSFLIPVFFLISIGMAIIYNMGSNMIRGEISYVTEALAAVLQLAVTMDYSIFLWHTYGHEKRKGLEKEEAMANAIKQTFSSVIGSSITTVAGFIALMFMSFTLGADLGIVMAKGVVIGVICCITILPSMILIFDRALEKTSHRPLLPDFKKLSAWIVDKYWVFLILFALILGPAVYGYTHNEVYYNLDSSLPKELPSITANAKLNEEFNMNSTHIIILKSGLSEKKINSLISDVKNVDGVKAVLGIESVVGPMVPREMIPEDLLEVMDNGDHEILMVMSEYKVASDEVNHQCDEIGKIVKSYDETGMLIGEAPCTKDLIEVTDKDFTTVSGVSIGVILLIIVFVFRSASIPVLLVAAIEFAIFINMGIPHYTGTVLPFVASIVIGTIQLGSTVDYAILLTNHYKDKRTSGLSKKQAITEALQRSISSIIVSALTFFAATFGVGVYSKIDMISSLCTLMARGAIISMFTVILLVPAFLYLADGLIIHTTLGFGHLKEKNEGLKTAEGVLQ